MRMITRLVALLLALVSLPVHAQKEARDEVQDILSAVVRVRAKIVPDARSAPTLGLQREGTGVIVRENYVATIGYLVIEAESIEVTGADGKAVPATLAGYDHASGYGVLRLLAPLSGKPLPFGNAAAVAERDPVLVASYGGRDGLSVVHVVSRRPFSGSWEYLLDKAIWTYPAVRNWSGAPLIGPKGDFLGIGSLVVADSAGGGEQSPGNMFVPSDLLRPILDELIAKGRRAAPQQPWLGMTTEEMRGRLFVSRVSPDGPADRAGVRSGDIVVGVGGEEVSTLADFYRKVWARGAAGVEVPLRFLQGVQVKEIRVRSIDRTEYFRKARGY
jgi:serine protease Do